MGELEVVERAREASSAGKGVRERRFESLTLDKDQLSSHVGDEDVVLGVGVVSHPGGRGRIRGDS